MFVFDRSAAAVIVPIALLIAVVLWSGRSEQPATDTAQAETASEVSTVAQADEPRVQGG
jgi:predicted membrane-bound mannosyltransferase